MDLTGINAKKKYINILMVQSLLVVLKILI